MLWRLGKTNDRIGQRACGLLFDFALDSGVFFTRGYGSSIKSWNGWEEVLVGLEGYHTADGYGQAARSNRVMTIQEVYSNGMMKI